MPIPTLTLKRFNPEIHKMAKLQAVKEDITLKALVEKAVKEYVERQEQKEKKGG